MTTTSIWIKTFRPFVKFVKTKFKFIEESENYTTFIISIANRECSIVYRGKNKVSIVIIHDLSSLPHIFFTPLLLTDAHGAARTFELNEAIRI